MSTRSAATGTVDVSECLDFDAIVIGAGASRLYQLYKLRELGLRVRVFEAGSEVGGALHQHRYRQGYDGAARPGDPGLGAVGRDGKA